MSRVSVRNGKQPSRSSTRLSASPRELRALGTVSEDTLERLRQASTPWALLLMGLAVGASIALYGGRGHVAPRLFTRNPMATGPSRRSRLLAAAAVLLRGALPAVLGSWLVWVTFDALDLVPARIEPVVSAILRGLAFVAFVRALANAVLAPGYGPWRLMAMSEGAAARIV